MYYATAESSSDIIIARALHAPPSVRLGLEPQERAGYLRGTARAPLESHIPRYFQFHDFLQSSQARPSSLNPSHSQFLSPSRGGGGG